MTTAVYAFETTLSKTDDVAGLKNRDVPVRNRGVKNRYLRRSEILRFVASEPRYQKPLVTPVKKNAVCHFSTAVSKTTSDAGIKWTRYATSEPQ